MTLTQFADVIVPFRELLRPVAAPTQHNKNMNDTYQATTKMAAVMPDADVRETTAAYSPAFFGPGVRSLNKRRHEGRRDFHW